MPYVQYYLPHSSESVLNLTLKRMVQRNCKAKYREKKLCCLAEQSYVILQDYSHVLDPTQKVCWGCSCNEVHETPFFGLQSSTYSLHTDTYLITQLYQKRNSNHVVKVQRKKMPSMFHVPKIRLDLIAPFESARLFTLHSLHFPARGWALQIDSSSLGRHEKGLEQFLLQSN